MARQIARTGGKTPKFFADLANLVQGLVKDFVDPYRPELHYMITVVTPCQQEQLPIRSHAT